MNVYRRAFEETKYMSFLIKYDELLEKYNEIWDKIGKVIKKRFYSEPVYKENIIMDSSHCIFFSVTLIDSVSKIGKNYHPQVFLEECKYIVKAKK